MADTPTDEDLISDLWRFAFSDGVDAVRDVLSHEERESNKRQTDAAMDALRKTLSAWRAALTEIAMDFDHDQQTRDHRAGRYSGTCRVCTAQRALARAAFPVDAPEVPND